MQVSKWGNSLAVRIPAAIAEALSLKEGDDIEIRVAGKHGFDLEKGPTFEEMLAKLRRIRKPIPKGYRFDREEANER